MGPCGEKQRIPGSDGREEDFHNSSIHFFLVYYFLLPILVGYAPQFMSIKVWGNVNLVYLFALSQFFMAWIIAGLYVKAGDNFDEISKDIIERALDREKSKEEK